MASLGFQTNIDLYHKRALECQIDGVVDRIVNPSPLTNIESWKLYLSGLAVRAEACANRCREFADKKPDSVVAQIVMLDAESWESLARHAKAVAGK